MTDPTRTRHEWDCGDTRVVRTTDETGHVSVWAEDARTGTGRLPITKDLLEAAATAIQFDPPTGTPAKPAVWVDDDITTPTNRSPWAEPIPTNPSYGG